MNYYLKIYSVLLRLNISALIEYRANFFNSLLGTIGWAVVSITSMILLTSRVKIVYGWTPDELLAVTGLYSILIGVFSLFFSRNFERFSRIIHKGELDTILLKPIDSQFLLSFWVVNYPSIARIFIGIGFLWYILQRMHIAVTMFSIVNFLLLTFCGVILLYSLWFCVMTIIIKLTNLTNLIDFLYSFNNLGRYPPEMIKQTRNIFIFILLPFTLTATIPIRTLLSKASFVDIEILTLCSFGSLFLSRILWKFALRFYTSGGG
ncbi:MAG TPA: ABC-2 family transporter protein [Candidatus Saccharimonadales bacterium]|nr:ABC-2 family transporter protein [Candidatus Saccharimonadales bacterium]